MPLLGRLGWSRSAHSPVPDELPTDFLLFPSLDNPTPLYPPAALLSLSSIPVVRHSHPSIPRSPPPSAYALGPCLSCLESPLPPPGLPIKRPILWLAFVWVWFCVCDFFFFSSRLRDESLEKYAHLEVPKAFSRMCGGIHSFCRIFLKFLLVL